MVLKSIPKEVDELKSRSGCETAEVSSTKESGSSTSGVL